MARTSVSEVLAALSDPGTEWIPWDPRTLIAPDEWDRREAGLSDEYRHELQHARARTGQDESIVSGTVTIDGHSVAVLACNFDFLAGSAGQLACDLVVATLARAGSEGLPVVALPSSGGTRMQEGTRAFVHMADMTRAVATYRSRGLPLLNWLRHPTTGGVMATWASLGSLVWGEPGALTGFLGPRVYESLFGDEFPAGVQEPGHLTRTGVLDGAVALDELRPRVVAFLTTWRARRPSPGAATEGALAEVTLEGGNDAAARVDDWDCVLATRAADWPTLADFLNPIEIPNVITGTGTGESASTLIAGLTTLDAPGGSIGCVLIAQDAGPRSGLDQRPEDALTPGDLRVADRAIELASELGLPIVTVVNTWGAQLSAQAEESGLAGQIARTLMAITGAPVPTLSVLLGPGCGGGALALFPADYRIAFRRSWLSPLPLEGASVITHRTVDRADEMARLGAVGAESLLDNGTIDAVVPDLVDLDGDRAAAVNRMWAAVGAALTVTLALDDQQRLAQRHARLRQADSLAGMAGPEPESQGGDARE